MKNRKALPANKFVLGTANFNMKYGLNNTKSFFKRSTILKVLKIIKKKNFLYLDTARDYNNTEKILGSFNLKNFKIITKIKNIRTKKNICDDLENNILKSINNLNIKKLYGLLLHSPLDLKKPHGKKIYKVLLSLKKKGFVKKIGYSINSPGDLNTIYKKFKPDLIQTPLNIFDQRIIQSGWLKRMRKDKIEIHARSIFLQGLLLRKKKDIPKRFIKFKNDFNKWYIWLNKNNCSALSACLNFVFSKKEIGKIVFGIDNIKQLNDILNIEIKNYNSFSNLKSNNINLINPSRWKIKQKS